VKKKWEIKGYKAVADLEIFRGGFSFTKMSTKLEVKTKKMAITSF